MGVTDASGDLVELYEVKTSAARTDVYSAIGQLMVHGPASCKKFVVLPEGQPLAPDLACAFRASTDHPDAFQTAKAWGDDPLIYEAVRLGAQQTWANARGAWAIRERDLVRIGWRHRRCALPPSDCQSCLPCRGVHRTETRASPRSTIRPSWYCRRAFEMVVLLCLHRRRGTAAWYLSRAVSPSWSPRSTLKQSFCLLGSHGLISSWR